MANPDPHENLSQGVWYRKVSKVSVRRPGENDYSPFGRRWGGIFTINFAVDKHPKYLQLDFTLDQAIELRDIINRAIRARLEFLEDCASKNAIKQQEA